MSEPVTKRVAIIGAGPGGLVSIKQCRDDGIDVVCFEATDNLGGLWCYRDQGASVTKSTIINTSKELNAISDFPPPTESANYFHNEETFKYLKAYAQHNELAQNIRYNSRIVGVAFANDHEETGRWIVTIDKLDLNEQYSEVFDGVMVCTGHHTTPLLPAFPGQEKFKGQITHTHAFKTAKGFEGKNVVVVGVGNSGMDTAVEMSAVAKNAYLSTRRGVWVTGRIGPFGWPYDSWFATRFCDLIRHYVPRFANWFAEKMAGFNFDHELYGLKPKHRFFQQHPSLSDTLPTCIMSGRVKVVRNIQEFTEYGMIFEGSDEVVQVDHVILATGYQMNFPFLDKSILSFNKNDAYLYKNMFNPTLPHPNTLALIGLVQPYGAGFPLGEIQARWYAGLMAGYLKLPTKEEMIKAIDSDRKICLEQFVETPRHSLEVHYMPFMNEIADYAQVRPNLLKYLFTDPVLWYKLVFGMFVAYQFRLEGKNSWLGARDAILNVNDRIKAPFKNQSNLNNNNQAN